MRRMRRIGILGAVLSVTIFATTCARGQDDVWRRLDPENTLYIEMDRGRVIVELAPDLAPKNVAQLKRLVREGRYTNTSFYRVIENFVAQGGLEVDVEDIPALQAEFEWEMGRLDGVTPVESNDPFAAQTGLYNGFALGYDNKEGREWAIHCPGVMALARENEADSATSDFYFPIGQAPRHLDRNLTIVGRVLQGFRFIQGAYRGDRDSAGGVIGSKTLRTAIKSMAIAADLDPADRTRLEVINTSHPRFLEQLDAQRNRKGAFWHHGPTSFVDVCTVPVPVRPGN
ncbi:peptidyl-prolyl cis-trans isomerase [Iodidimonas muriae]|uniref:peptidylprolyl isomerase n=1 Tax=Iodidimonas muriae TaxID=261467 RepID=A0ABQ2LFP2_9PROT|nr:peptidylprolyl isomerase [Iodidimonas muriae]GGO14940.1 peptidyl-prolyl cis-trans isomerase [Iodidimonas muriae]